MTDREDLLVEIIEQALLLDSNSRDDYLRSRCGTNSDLLHDVRTLLRNSSNENEQLEMSAFSLESEIEFTKDSPLLDRYEVGAIIGRGGMGNVYEGRQKSPHRKVAIKFLPAEVTEVPTFVERFTREASLMAQLDHPNIVKVIESSQVEDTRYIVMEYVAGIDGGTPISFREILKKGPLGEDQVLKLSLELTSALSFAHRQGIIHRDIKPSNILIDRHGSARIIDFGIATSFSSDDQKLTSGNITMGTPAYMSPEQRKNSSAVDERSDIYSLGLMIYEMLVGDVPEGLVTLPSHKSPLISRKWEDILVTATRKNPTERFQSMDELQKALLCESTDQNTELSQEESVIPFSWYSIPPWKRFVISTFGFAATLTASLWMLLAGITWWTLPVLFVSNMCATEILSCFSIGKNMRGESMRIERNLAGGLVLFLLVWTIDLASEGFSWWCLLTGLFCFSSILVYLFGYEVDE